VATPSFRAKADQLGVRIRVRLDQIAGRVPAVGEVRGLGPMLAIELVTDRETKQPAGDLAKQVTDRARERGLVLLACGLDGNIVRILVPILAADADLDEGLAILEEALVDASDGAS
jgi:4-aminobutyrate aminotransferase / (S)-3-amino-2-methylpropionate transaminase / 5-aminovalerate transaminase